MSEEGKTIKDIAEARGLAESTIKGHLAKGIGLGKVSIHQHLSEEVVGEIAGLIQSKEGNLAKIREEKPGKYDYNTLKMVAAFLSKEQE